MGRRRSQVAGAAGEVSVVLSRLKPLVITGIEQRDAGLERSLNRGHALVLVGRAVKIGHAHAAEAEGRHARTGCAKRSSDHVKYIYHTNLATFASIALSSVECQE